MATTSSPAQPLKRFFQMLALDKKEITYIYVYAIFAGLITLSLPLGIQAIIGLIAGGAISAAWLVLVGVVTVGTALTGILKIMQLTVTETLQRRVFLRSSFDFAYRLPRLKMESLNKEYPPELVNRFFDTLTIQKGLPKILTDFSTSILEILFGLLLLSLYHPFFALFSVLLIAIVVVIFWVVGPRGVKTSLTESTYKYQVAYWLEEMARTMSTFKLGGKSDLPMQNNNMLTNKYLDARKKHFRILLTQYGGIVGFKTVVTAALLLLGGMLVMDNQINLGQFVAAEIIILLVTAATEKLVFSIDTIYDTLTAVEKIGAVMDLPLEDEKGVDFEEIETDEGIKIDVNNLSYHFDNAEKPTLNNISFSIKPGEKVAIVGYSGAGKSTLIQILAGLYLNFKGSVNYNGFPLRNLNLTSLRARIGDHNLHEDVFRGTISDNICLRHENVGMQEIIKASERIGLDDYVRQLPEGYNTIILPEGRNMPRHVVRKIILARAIASDPSLLAMEEMMSNLEQKDRIRISDLLTDDKEAWTLVAVTDDPILAARCDRILVMKDGNIIDDCTYASIKHSVHAKHIFKGADDGFDEEQTDLAQNSSNSTLNGNGA